jgi:hypothetical protein
MHAVCNQTQQEPHFRGYLEKTESEKRENNSEYRQRRTRYDEKFRVHLETSTVSIGTSHDIQNDLNDSISTVAVKKIKGAKNFLYVNIRRSGCRCI